MGKTPLELCAAENLFSTVGLLLSLGADPNLCESVMGFSPLHTAASKGFTQVAKILLDGGADAAMRTTANILSACAPDKWSAVAPSILAGKKDNTVILNNKHFKKISHSLALASAPCLSSAVAAATAPFSAALWSGVQPWALEAAPPDKSAPDDTNKSTAGTLSRPAATNRHSSRNKGS